MIRHYCEYIGFPNEATEYFCNLADKVDSHYIFTDTMKCFCEDKTDEHHRILGGIAEKYNVPRYSVDMLFLLSNLCDLQKDYENIGIPEEVFKDTLYDFKAKLYECKNRHGVWGTAVLWWHRRFFQLKTFGLGRLQYEKIDLEFDYGDYAHKGDEVLNCHIPSGAPLTAESVFDSLKKAYTFYNITGDMIVYCKTWMLCPEHYKLFPDNSNLRTFYDMFEVVCSETSDNADLWRIFNKQNFEDISASDVSTRLQRNFYEYLKSGNKMGVGEGILIYNRR